MLALEARAGEDGGGEEDAPVLKYHGLELKPDIKIYADYQISLDGDTDNAFHVGRAYLGMKLKITDWLGGRVTYDMSQAKDWGQAGALGGENDDEVKTNKLEGSFVSRLKYAYIDMKIKLLSNHVRIGIVHTPWIDWIEHIEDTRYLGKVMLEKEYHYPSADLGAMLAGNISDYVAYHLGFYNGAGYHGVEKNPFKDFIGRLSFRPLPHTRYVEALQLSLYGRTQVGGPGTLDVHRQYGGAITYRLVDKVKSPDCAKVSGETLALWFQIFGGQEGHEEDDTVSLVNSLGWSAGGRIELPADLFIIGRVDQFDPDVTESVDAYWRILATLGIRLHKGIHVSLAYHGKTYEDEDADGDHLLGIFSELRL